MAGIVLRREGHGLGRVRYRVGEQADDYRADYRVAYRLERVE